MDDLNYVLSRGVINIFSRGGGGGGQLVFAGTWSLNLTRSNHQSQGRLFYCVVRI